MSMCPLRNPVCKHNMDDMDDSFVSNIMNVHIYSWADFTINLKNKLDELHIDTFNFKVRDEMGYFEADIDQEQFLALVNMFDVRIIERNKILIMHLDEKGRRCEKR